MVVCVTHQYINTLTSHVSYIAIMSTLSAAKSGLKNIISHSKLSNIKSGIHSQFSRFKSSSQSNNTTESLQSSHSQSCPSFTPNAHQISCVPLSQPIPGFPNTIYASVSNEDQETKVSVLSNGLRVASQNKFGQFCTVGVVLDSGSRYEVSYPSGISHFLEKLAFNSTTEFSNKDAIMRALESIGGICDCQGSRDTLIYAASCESKGLQQVIHLLSQVILRPKITEQEVDVAKQIISFELEDIAMRPDQEPLLFEQIHAAAYRSNTLGLPKLCAEQSLPIIDRQIIFSYLKNYHTPERMVLAGVGIEHERMLEYANKYFVENNAIWNEDQNLTPKNNPEVDNSLAQYTGGIVAIEKDLSNISLGPTPIPELAHFVLGLESFSHHDLDEFIPICVLNMLMGGGGSFSAGGPGKGMYTRLYTQVLNKYHWMYNATAYNHAFNDSGLFCIHASAHPSQLRDLINVIIREVINMSGSISEQELNRAKTQLKSMLLMNLEARPVMFEDIGRQVLATGFRRPPQFFIDRIDKIGFEDIRRVALKMLRSRASVAVRGNIKNLPPLEDIETALNSKDGQIPKRFTLFR